MLVLVWVLLIAPQRRRQAQQKQMLQELNAGDEILTAGGIYATVLEVGEDRLRVELSPGLQVTLDRRAVAQRMTEEEPEQEPDALAADEEEPAALAHSDPVEGAEEHPHVPRT
jgi:preprotein translocase subunit YajC